MGHTAVLRAWQPPCGARLSRKHAGDRRHGTDRRLRPGGPPWRSIPTWFGAPAGGAPQRCLHIVAERPAAERPCFPHPKSVEHLASIAGRTMRESLNHALAQLLEIMPEALLLGPLCQRR